MFPFAASAVQQPARKPASAADLASGLKDCAERFVAALVKSLQTMAGSRTTIEGMLAGFGSLSTRDVSVAHRPEAVAALIECAGLPCTILATLDPPLVHAIVELLAGGSGAEPVPAEPRLTTSIDQQYAHIVVALAAAAIQAEWADQGFGAAGAKRLDGGVAPDVCGPRVTQVGVVSIALSVFGVRGTLSLALPPVALDAFAAAAAAGDFAGISQWDDDLKASEGSNKSRTLTFKNGEKIKEDVDEYDPSKMTYTYRMSDPNVKAVPASSYSATLTVTPGTDGGSHVEWISRVYRGDTGNEPPDELSDQSAKDAVGKLFKSGLEGLKAKTEGKS